MQNASTILQESLSGLIERVTFFNEDSGFGVLKVKAKGHRDLVTVVGSLPSVSAWEWLTAQGRWVQDREYGQQFRAEMLTSTPPTTKEGIEIYLGSGMVRGIGPVCAKKLVDKFGAGVLEIIEKASARLEDVDGIGPKRRKRIKEAWDEQKVIRDIMVFLHSKGVSTSRAVRIYKTYGEDAIEKVRSDPYRLTEVFRQAAHSRIITNAHRINEGRMLEIPAKDAESDFYFIEREEPEAITATLVEMVKTRIPAKFRFDPIRDIQVLCPMNRGSLGIRELNVRLQNELNPTRSDDLVVEKFGWQFRVRDKVIQTENDYDKDVFNGDVGQIVKIDPVEREVAIQFDQREVRYNYGELDEVSLAYAITIHKSQGSEFPVVVTPLAMQQYLLLQRNLVYTGITRGRKLVVLIGQRKALAMAVRNKRTEQRFSGLLARLMNAQSTVAR